MAAYGGHSSPFGGGGAQTVTLPVHLFIRFLGQISFIALVKNELFYQCDGQTNICDGQTNICDGQINICDGQANMCDRQTNIFHMLKKFPSRSFFPQCGNGRRSPEQWASGAPPPGPE